MPVASRMTKQYMAISPTMNDQWSGKILSRADRSHFDDPKRSSAQSSACCSSFARLRAADRSAMLLMLSRLTCSKNRARRAR